VDHRYPDLKGNLGQKESQEGGPGSGPRKKLAAEAEKLGYPDAAHIIRNAKSAGEIKDIAAKINDRAMAHEERGAYDRSKDLAKLSFKLHRHADEMSSGKESGKKGWTGRQRDMHKDLGKQLARESRSGRPAGPIPVDSDPDHPIDMRSISSGQTFREGWNGGTSYSPPVKSVKKVLEPETGVVVKEF
jgi:hypothetical protein